MDKKKKTEKTLEKLYSDRSAAERVGFSPSYIRDQRKAGKIRFVLFGEGPKPSVRIPESALIEWLERNGRPVPALCELNKVEV